MNKIVKDKKNGNIRNSLICVLSVAVLCLFSFMAGYAISVKEFNNRIEKVSMVYQQRLKDKSDENNKYVSISFDDTIAVFADLSQHKYETIFENATLCYLKNLHELYGACFTLYCYYENDAGDFNLSMMPDNYAAEFTKNADWLKWGFHSYNGKVTYDTVNEARAKSDYEAVIKELIRITGDEECIESIVRLSGFVGTENAVEQMVDCNNGIEGLLGPDDNRSAYFLSEEESLLLREAGSYKFNNILLLSTDLRIENHLKEKNLIDTSDSVYIVFSHEWKLKDSKVKETLEELCLEAIANQYEFVFPEVLKEQ